jgi:hypothetical protein
LILLSEGFKPDISFLIAFLAALLILPISISLGCTLYLSGLGEKRIVHAWDIALMAFPLIILVEFAIHYQDPSLAISRFFVFGMLLFPSGLGLDALMRSTLGVSGGRRNCLFDVLVSNTDNETTRNWLNDGAIYGSLEVVPIDSSAGYCLRSDESYGFNLFVFLLPHPNNKDKSVILFAAYDLTPFEIMSDKLTRARLTAKEVYLVTLLKGKIRFGGGPRTLESFNQLYPGFAFQSEKAITFALRATEIPFMRITRVPPMIQALLAAIGVPVLFLVLLFFGGYISQENLIVILLPTIVLIGLELFAVLFRRKE